MEVDKINEFNPTKKDLLLIEDLILTIKGKKQKLVLSKINLQNTLTGIKEKLKTIRHKSPEHKNIITTENHIKHSLCILDNDIKKLNDELTYKNKLKLEVEYHLKNNKSLSSLESGKVLNKLNALKIKYSDFAKDRTRVASLRVLANEFITEIENIIKEI